MCEREWPHIWLHLNAKCHEKYLSDFMQTTPVVNGSKSAPVSSRFSQLGVTALWMSSSATTLCVSPSPGSVTGRTTVGTTLTRILKNAVSAAF